MKKMHILVLLVIGYTTETAALTAMVTINASSSGTITSTHIAAAFPGGSTTGLGCGVGACTTDVASAASCSSNTSILHNTWNVGTGNALVSGANVKYLNIVSSSNVQSLDQILCRADGACNICFCIGDSSTSTSNGNCTISLGSVVPTCSGGHVESVTSNLTLSP